MLMLARTLMLTLTLTYIRIHTCWIGTHARARIHTCLTHASTRTHAHACTPINPPAGVTREGLIGGKDVAAIGSAEHCDRVCVAHAAGTLCFVGKFAI